MLGSMPPRLPVVLSLLVVLLAAPGCSGSGSSTAGSAASSGTVPAGDDTTAGTEAKTLPIPGQMPPGHPPAAGSSRGAQLVWRMPDAWTAETPRSSMRLAQYRVPGGGGDGECVAYYFGPGQGGDAMANAERWAGQFSQPDGRSSVDLMKVSKVEGTSVPTQLVEVTGTYNGGMTMTDAPAKEQPGYMLLGAIIEGPDANWFFKFTGPKATVEANREKFLELLRSVREAS